MKIYICDDDKNMYPMLAEWIREYLNGSECQVETYDNGIDLIYELKNIESSGPDIIFMDIKLKNDNGIDVAKLIKKENKNAVIIFISGYTEYFEDSFEAEPVYFLIKPLKKEMFLRAMDKAMEKMEQKKEKYLLFRKKDVSRIFFDDIYYVESIGRKIHIHCRQGEFEYYEKLDFIMNQLEGEFVKCHKSYLVNMKWIQQVDNKAITLMNGIEIPVSRNRMTETKDKVFEYLGRQFV